MELIQNADDNKYNTEYPQINISYNTEEMIIQNNEIGFNDDDVKSICDVGKSNKKKNQGYIGEKGIGFKSVFKVSDDPEIYSNCFRFKFNRRDNESKLGFVVPIWIQNKPQFIKNTETTIILHFNEAFKANKELKKLDDVKDPMLLVFLNKLNRMEVLDQASNEKHFFSKDIVNGSIIIKCRIECEKEIEETKFVWKTYHHLINTEDIEEDKRKDIKETKIILAYPLKDNGTPNIEHQKIFTFLPVKQSELKFVVQADFILTSSREEILLDKQWNRRMIDAVGNAFINSLTVFKNDEKLKTTWYQYIPKENDLHDNDPFKRVVMDIHEELRKTDCILTESGTWVIPDETLWASIEIQNLIPAEIYGKKHYVNHEIKDDAKGILEELGVKIQKEHSLILSALNNIPFLRSKIKDDNWNNNLYRFLNEKIYIKNQWQDKEIRRLPIIRAEDGSLNIPADIFFKLSNEQLKEYEEIPVIKYVDLNGISEKEFLENIGVNKSHNLDKIVKQILKGYKNKDSNRWAPIQRGNCNKYIEVWLNEHQWKVSEEYELGIIEVLTNNGWKRADDCYFLDDKLKDILPEGTSFVELKGDGNEGIFLEKIGVKSYPRILIKDKISIQNTEEVEDIEQYAEWLEKNGNRAKDADEEQWNIHILDGFKECISKKDEKLLRIFLEYLINNWDKYYSKYAETNYEIIYKNKPAINDKPAVPSYFAYKIKDSEWLPTKKGVMKPGRRVFQSYKTVQKFSSDFPYIEIENELLIKGKNFFDFIELSSQLDLDTLLKVLNDLKDRDEENKRDLVFEIYKKIISKLENAENSEIKNNIDLHLLSIDSNFYPISELYWNDHPKGTYFKSIKYLYIPDELGGYDNKVLFEDFFEIKRVSEVIKSDLINLPNNEENHDCTNWLRKRLTYIERLFSYNHIKYPPIFNTVRVFNTEKIEVRLIFKNDTQEDYIPLEDVKAYCDIDTCKIYRRYDADDFDLAIGIAESLDAKNIASDIERIIALEPEEIENRFSKLGIEILKKSEGVHVVPEIEPPEEPPEPPITEPIKESMADRIMRTYPKSEQIDSIKDIDKSQQEIDFSKLSFEADISIEVPHYKKRKIRSLLTERKKDVTDKVKQWYGHKCQICGESFETKGGNRYAEGHHFIPIKDEKECEDIDNLGNVLCVCPKCHSIMQYGKFEPVGINLKTKEWLFKKDKEGFYYLNIVFKGIIEEDKFVPEKNAYIKYNQKHLEHLQRFLEIYGINDKIVVSGEYI